MVDGALPCHLCPSKPSHSCTAILQVVVGVGLLLLSLGALGWQARHWLGVTQEVCVCWSCFACLPCVLLSALLNCGSDAFPLLLCSLKPLTGSNGRRIGHISWGNGGAVSSRTVRSVASSLERHFCQVAAAAQMRAA